MRYDIKTTPYIDGRIMQEVALVYDHEFESVHQQIMRTVIDTMDQQVRTALVAMGWTPPV